MMWLIRAWASSNLRRVVAPRSAIRCCIHDVLIEYDRLAVRIRQQRVSVLFGADRQLLRRQLDAAVSMPVESRSVSDSERVRTPTRVALVCCDDDGHGLL